MLWLTQMPRSQLPAFSQATPRQGPDRISAAQTFPWQPFEHLRVLDVPSALHSVTTLFSHLGLHLSSPGIGSHVPSEHPYLHSTTFRSPFASQPIETEPTHSGVQMPEAGAVFELLPLSLHDARIIIVDKITKHLFFLFTILFTI
jgi:hypothetical protein